MDEFIKKILSDKKIPVIALAVIGLILILIAYIPSKKNNSSIESSFDESTYVSDLEKKIGEIVSSIYGAGKCEVMINIISTTESVYVKENKKHYNSSDTNSTTETEDSVLTMTDGEGNQYAVVTKQIMPEIGGVTVVCDGGDDTKVRINVIDAVSTVLGIGSNKVCVIAKSK